MIDKKILIGMLLMFLLISGVVLAIPKSSSDVPPPTDALMCITDGIDEICADTYDDAFTFTAGSNSTIIIYPSNKTIRFESADTSGSGSDNLGNHVATQNLDLNGNDLIIDADGDTKLKESLDDNLIWEFNGTDWIQWKFSTASLLYLHPTTQTNYIFGTNLASPTAGILATVDFNGNDTAGNSQRFASFRGQSFDVTDGTEYGGLELLAAKNGAVNVAMSIVSSNDRIRVFDYDFGIDPTDVYYYDGFGNTFTQEFAADHLKTKVGGKWSLTLDTGSAIIGNTFQVSNGRGVLVLANDLPPTTSPNNAVQLYSNDISGSAELHVRDEAGNISILSPHSFDHVERKAATDWAFNSYNPYIGKGVSISNYEVLRALEEVTGKTLIHEYDLPPEKLRDWNADQLALKEYTDTMRGLALKEKSDLEQRISTLNLIKDKSPDEIYELNELLIELDGFYIPEIYQVKPRPAYFDMIESVR